MFFVCLIDEKIYLLINNKNLFFLIYFNMFFTLMWEKGGSR